MVTMIIGGSGSGKSRYAERLVSSLDGRRIYLATMQPFGEEAHQRIAKHLRERSGLGFETVECFRNLKTLRIPKDSNVLLEDVGNLMANERYHPDGGGKEAVISGIGFLMETCRHVTIVTNEVFSGGKDYEGDTLEYLKDLAWVNRQVAMQADHVVEIVCGLPNRLK